MIGFILMAHRDLPRAEALAKHILAHDCPVVLHIDTKADRAEYEALAASLGDHPLVRFAPRLNCEWGTFSLVRASLGAAQLMLDQFQQVNHVGLISGSCLPIKSISAIRGFVADFPDADFIESVSAKEDAWIIGGLSSERFKLFFPFSWLRHRWIFDKFVDLQRRLGVSRKMPGGLEPYIGSQWWTLSASTLRKVLDDPELSRICRFFNWTWIPDETFFQSMARKHSQKVISKSLTLAQFDPQGKPFIFHDDHLTLLLLNDTMFVRKAWPGANRLYDTLLGPKVEKLQPAKPDTSALDRMMRRATNVRGKGRRGLTNQSRYASASTDHVSARPYFVFDGVEHLIPDFLERMQSDLGIEMHGALFEPDRVDFKGGAEFFAGNLTNIPAIRDRNPRQFLANLIWSRRRVPQGLLMRLDRLAPITKHVLGDRNAQVIRVRDAWPLDLLAALKPEEPDFHARMWLRHLQQQRLNSYLAWRAGPSADVISFSIRDFLISPGAVRARLENHIPAASQFLELIDEEAIRKQLAQRVAEVEASDLPLEDFAAFQDLKQIVALAASPQPAPTN